MKRFYFIAFSLIAMLTMFSCKNNENEEINLDVNVENVSGQWVEAQLYMNGQTFDVNGSTYNFKTDGTFHLKTLEAETDGTWSINDKNLVLVEEDPTGKVTTVFNIDKLTNLTLVLAWEVNDNKYASTYKRK